MEVLIPLFAIFFVIGVPVLSIATRFVLRPLLRDFAQALGRGQQPDADQVAELTQRMARIEAHLVEQDRRLGNLADAELFRRQLEERSSGMSQLPPHSQAGHESDPKGLTGPGH